MMNAALLLLALSAPASGQELTLHPGWLIQPVAGKVWENGVGAPAVAYDAAADRWVMYFETQFGPVDDDCRTGRWGIGRATSPDGLTWTVDDDLVITPQPGTYYDCVVAHPDVIFDGTTWRLWFKAHQRNTVCDDGQPAPAWGCAAITGVGYATSADGVVFDVTEAPVVNLFSFGFPSVVKVDGILRMLLAYSNAGNDVYELWEAVSTDDGASWSLPQFILGPGFDAWVDDEIYNPAVTCDEAMPATPYTLFAGGRDKEAVAGGPPRIVTAGLGRATSADGVNFTWDAVNPLQSWNLAPPEGPPDRDWRHWDAMRIGDEHLLFFSERDDLGRNRIGLAYTHDSVQATFEEALISDRICGAELPPPDTDTVPEPPDTDVPLPTDTDTGTPPGTGLPDPEDSGDDGCGCAQGNGSSAWALAAALAALLRRRARPLRPA